MNELEQLKKELEEALEKVKAYEWQEKEKKEEKKELPNIGQDYYYMEIRITTPYVVKETWHNFPIDISRWVHCCGAYTRAEVEWTIKHNSLIDEIKKYTRPFNNGIGNENWWFYKKRIDSEGGETSCLDMDWCSCGEPTSEYGFFDCEDSAEDIREQFGDKYILKFLFRPTDGNYKALMEWLAEQEGE